jgi:hypothetical protein
MRKISVPRDILDVPFDRPVRKFSNLLVGAQTIRAPRLDLPISRRECDDCDSDSCCGGRTLSQFPIENPGKQPRLVCVGCPPCRVGDRRAHRRHYQLHFRAWRCSSRPPWTPSTRGRLVAHHSMPYSRLLFGARQCCMHRARLCPGSSKKRAEACGYPLDTVPSVDITANR